MRQAPIEDQIALLIAETTQRLANLFANHHLSARPRKLSDVITEHIGAVFDACQGNLSDTARYLGVHRRTLQRVIKRQRGAYGRKNSKR